MERKQASDFDPELLSLFDGYVHGAINRREFLDGAARFAIGGLTAMGLWEMLRPNYALAQQVPKDDKRISIYVLGDEFSTGSSVDQVIQAVDEANRRDSRGRRRQE